MNGKLFCQAIAKFFIGLLLVGALLFVPAGTFDYWQAWLLLGILFVPMVCAGVVMMLKNPELLQKRLQIKEQEPAQRQVVAFSGVIFFAAFAVAGLNVRFGWYLLPAWVCWAAAGMFLIAYGLYAEVLRENTYLSRTVEIQENQKVIDTGLYGLVRHPMYMATLLLFFCMPLVLGSIFSFLILLLYLPVICKRIHNEEKVLERGLAGYRDYKSRVRYRLLPYIW